MLVRADLHSHTLHSEGRASPADLVEARRREGVTALAIGDNDVMSGVGAAAVHAAKAGLFFVPALEVTSHLHYGEAGEEHFHLLAYFPRSTLDGAAFEQTRLYARGVVVQERWRAFVLDWLSTRPAEDRAAIDPEGELERRPAAAFPAVQSTIERLASRRRASLEPFLAHHGRFWSSAGPNRDVFGWSPEAAIEMIVGDGATAIVAHPGRYRDEARTMEVIRASSGVEAFSPHHDAAASARWQAHAEQTGKLWTAASDDHQLSPYQRPRSGVPLRTIERLARETIDLQTLLAR